MPTRPAQTPRSSASRSGGFTLLEVLIALLVLSVGLLGIAGLQLTSLRSNHSAYLRSQATILGYDILDRMRANRAQAQAGEYNINSLDDLPSTDDDSSQAAADLESWGTDVLALPGAGATVKVNTANNTVSISISWDDSRADQAPDRSGTTVTDPTKFEFQTEF